ncbi:MAG: ABC transporter ATP-binding protein [Thauera sp.]|nr:ABC transporter ATP-binding protein [Thauera sp.]
MHPSAPPLIRFDNLTLGYERHPAVHHLSGEIRAGALVAVIGPNGAGKSTLLKGVAGELRPIGGHIDLGTLTRSAVAYMPQRSEIDPSFPVSVFEVVAMGLWRELGAFGGLNRKQRERVRAALTAVGMAGFESRPIGSLSGGQLQRARFARLMLQNAPLILLDEPFAAIDSRTVEDLIRVMLGWHAEGRTILTVVHDFDQVRRHFPTCLLLAREPVAFGPTAQVLTDTLLARARRLSEAFDEDAPECHREDADAERSGPAGNHGGGQVVQLRGHRHGHPHDHPHAPPHDHSGHRH